MSPAQRLTTIVLLQRRAMKRRKARQVPSTPRGLFVTPEGAVLTAKDGTAYGYEVSYGLHVTPDGEVLTDTSGNAYGFRE